MPLLRGETAGSFLILPVAPILFAPAKVGRRFAHGRPNDACLDACAEPRGLASGSHLDSWNVDEPSILKQLPACQGD